MSEQNIKANPLAGFVAIIFIVFMIWLVFNFVKGLFSILSFIAIPLFVLALIFNYRVVGDYFKWIFKMIKEDTGKGVLAGLASVIGYPVVAAYLFFKAFATRKIARREKKKKPGDYIKYEEVDDEDFLELPDIAGEELKEPLKDGRYDDLFE